MKFLTLLSLAALAFAQSPLRFEKAVPLPGVEGRFDHLSIDVHGKRLFVSALGNNTVEVIDLAAGKHLQSLTGMAEPQGIAASPDVHKVYVANGKDGKVRMFDALTLKPTGEIMFGEDADNVRYDAPRKQIWVGYKDGAIGGLDVVSGARVGDVYLDGHPESFQLEKSGGRIFVNVPDAKEIEVVDRLKKIVVAKWPVTNPAANFPMVLDEASHRLFVGCRKPARVLVFDIDSGKQVANFACPGDTDDLYYDAARKRVYVAGGEGFLEAFQQNGDQYTSLGKTATAAGARTALFSTDLNRIYLAVPHRGTQGAEIRIYTVE